MKTKLLTLQKNYLVVLALLITSFSFSQNLYDSSGNIIWDATANSGYNNDVNFIGRDDAINLNKKQIVSSIPRICLGTLAPTNEANPNTFASDKNYLVWGDNGGTTNDSGTDITINLGGTSNLTTSVDIPNRIWKVVESGGDVGETKLYIPTSLFNGLPALTANDAYVLIVANDSNFSSGVETAFFVPNASIWQAVDFDFDGTKYFTIGIAHKISYNGLASLNGINDVIKFNDVNNLASSFTIMFWMKPMGQNSLGNNRTIISKSDGTTGYKIYLTTSNKLRITWNGGTTHTSNTYFPDNEWHNVAVTYNNGTTALYIDGVLDSTTTSAPVQANSNIFAIGAEFRSKSNIQNHFKGELDEIRIWKRSLTLSQVRYIINQEIMPNGTNTTGTVIPFETSKNEMKSMNWSNLIAYYSMNSYIGTTVNDESQYKNRGQLLTNNPISIAPQTAPMPYESVSNGLWSDSTTWANGLIPNTNSIVNPSLPITWSIVKTSHNINSPVNQTLLGLIVNSNSISVTSDKKLEITHYLKLDGKIDLVGRSQLVQTDKSDLDVTSVGHIEKDQQGQSNQYNYNYWSSPVSVINGASNNVGYTVASVMKDGTTSTPQNINWTSGINGSPTSPITLSSYWIFKFQNLSNGYANWSAVGQNGNLMAGQGFTLKGPGSPAANQNYTFIGKPNNGTITTSVAAGNLNLSGNPYPSAIDANRFIDDNASSITGTLYFWEHYNTNNSHATIQYQGGYATYTKTGGTAPVAPSGVSGTGSSRKKPGRYIPVGQGFFVTGSSSGGTITFNNNMRTFAKETDSGAFQLFRTNDASERQENTGEEQFTKLYLGFDSADQLHRQILIGFMNENATSGIDAGYDGISLENLTNDFYFINGNTKLNIQGEGYFDINAIYPVGVKNAVEGVVKFSIDEKENLEESHHVYIYDNLTNEYHDITTESWEITLPAGTFDNRFSMRFLNPDALGTAENDMQNGIIITHSQTDEFVTIKNELLLATINSVSVYNIVGQNVLQWKLESQNQQNIELSVGGLNTGTYIVKVSTDKGSLSKKIIIQ